MKLHQYALLALLAVVRTTAPGHAFLSSWDSATRPYQGGKVPTAGGTTGTTTTTPMPITSATTPESDDVATIASSAHPPRAEEATMKGKRDAKIEHHEVVMHIIGNEAVPLNYD